MKLTWFRATAFRIQIGGQIVVVDAHAAPEEVDGAELISGANRVVSLDENLAPANGGTWRPRAAQRLLESGGELRPLGLYSIGAGSLLIDADEDRPLLVLEGDVLELGHWVSQAVIILCGTGLAERAERLIAGSSPRLIALAASDREVDATFAALRDKLGDTGLIALEPGLAVEA
jgi:hypothetical protein